MTGYVRSATALLLFFWLPALLVFSLPSRALPHVTNKTPLLIIKKSSYTIGYSKSLLSPLWAFQTITRAQAKKAAPLTSSPSPIFDPVGPKITPSTLSLTSYTAIYLADALTPDKAESLPDSAFTTSDLVLATPFFYNSIWRRLKALTRAYAKRYKMIYVVSGPVFGSSPHREISLPIPQGFFRVIYDPQRDKMIAFYSPNEGTSHSLQRLVTSTAFIEKKTGIVFFPFLEKKHSAQLKNASDLRFWFFDAPGVTEPAPKLSADPITQCIINSNTLSECLTTGGNPHHQ